MPAASADRGPLVEGGERHDGTIRVAARRDGGGTPGLDRALARGGRVAGRAGLGAAARPRCAGGRALIVFGGRPAREAGSARRRAGVDGTIPPAVAAPRGAGGGRRGPPG